MSKVLFVSHGFACFMSDILFHGLKKAGHEVYEYPQGTHYYGGDSIFGGNKNLGKDTFLNFCYFNFKKHDLTDDEILNQDYDYIIITSWRPEQPWILENIYKRFKGNTPIAWVDGEDDLHIRTQEFYSDIYFKREMPLQDYDMWAGRGIKPINFGIIVRDGEPMETRKNHLLSFIASGHDQRGLRCVMFRKFMHHNLKEKIFSLDVERSKGGFLSYAEYRKVISGSQISLSIRGEGYDTYRFWEIPYFGAMLMADEPTIMIENNFTDMQNAVFFKSMDDFDSKFEYLANNLNVVEKIARAGYKFLIENHTSLHRAEYVLKKMGEI